MDTTAADPATPAPPTPAAAPPGLAARAPLPRRLSLVMAVATGVAVGNLYYARRLLGAMARSFHLPLAPPGLVAPSPRLATGFGLLLLTPVRASAIGGG